MATQADGCGRGFTGLVGMASVEKNGGVRYKMRSHDVHHGWIESAGAGEKGTCVFVPGAGGMRFDVPGKESTLGQRFIATSQQGISLAAQRGCRGGCGEFGHPRR